MARNWSDQEVKKAAKKTAKRLERLAKKHDVTIDELFDRLHVASKKL